MRGGRVWGDERREDMADGITIGMEGVHIYSASSFTSVCVCGLKHPLLANCFKWTLKSFTTVHLAKAGSKQTHHFPP